MRGFSPGLSERTGLPRWCEIVPPGVVVNLKGKLRSMVWLGSYILSTSGCDECHTHPGYSPDGNPFAPRAVTLRTTRPACW